MTVVDTQQLRLLNKASNNRPSTFFLILLYVAQITRTNPVAHYLQNQKSNDPADLQKPSENTGGLRSSQSAFQAAPGPVMLNQQMLNNLGPAKVCSSKSQYTGYCSTI